MAGGNGGTAVTAGAGGTGESGGTAGEQSPDPQSTTKAAACRDFFTAACARIRECDAPTFRPCESPIDACPDILFADGSAWTVEQVQACTAEWATHECAALGNDEWPACAQVLGTRASGSACVFDSQCQTGRCNGGIVPSYETSCGVCGDFASSHGDCSPTLVCPAGEYCQVNQCFDMTRAVIDPACLDVTCPDGEVCAEGFCTNPLTLGQPCGPTSHCAAGLACQIELVSLLEDEPTMGTCQPLPAIGQPCLPTFTRLGLCAEGGTCTGRPSGDCVALRQVGESCGFTACVDGAYCSSYEYDHVEPYICHARGQEGSACDYDSRDGGAAGCAAGLACLCGEASCNLGVCGVGRQVGESCNGTTELCTVGLVCDAALCVDPSAITGVAAGSHCLRSTAYGRESDQCADGLECLCTSATCEMTLCATPRLLGESCNNTVEVCRQGLSCDAGLCANASARDLEAESCTDPP